MADMQALLSVVASDIESEITKRTDKKFKEFVDKIETATKDINDMVTTGGTLHVTIGDAQKKPLDGLKHKQLKKLITIAANRLPVLLVGMAGTGKTHAAEQVAAALDLDFYAMSVGAQTRKSDLMGFIHAGGMYMPTLFRRAFEEGGVFLMDEIDAGNANVLIQVNAALSNGYCAFPDRMVKKHDDFVFIASANTYGMGASRQYVGRNQLDAATLDRFTMLDWDVDDKLEKALAGDDELGQKWLKVVRTVRAHIDREGLRALVTPRATVKGSRLLRAGMDFSDVLRTVILGGIQADKQRGVELTAKQAWVEA